MSKTRISPDSIIKNAQDGNKKTQFVAVQQLDALLQPPVTVAKQEVLLALFRNGAMPWKRIIEICIKELSFHDVETTEKPIGARVLGHLASVISEVLPTVSVSPVQAQLLAVRRELLVHHTEISMNPKSYPELKKHIERDLQPRISAATLESAAAQDDLRQAAILANGFTRSGESAWGASKNRHDALLALNKILLTEKPLLSDGQVTEDTLTINSSLLRTLENPIRPAFPWHDFVCYVLPKMSADADGSGDDGVYKNLEIRRTLRRLADLVKYARENGLLREGSEIHKIQEALKQIGRNQGVGYSDPIIRRVNAPLETEEKFTLEARIDQLNELREALGESKETPELHQKLQRKIAKQLQQRAKELSSMSARDPELPAAVERFTVLLAASKIQIWDRGIYNELQLIRDQAIEICTIRKLLGNIQTRKRTCSLDELMQDLEFKKDDEQLRNSLRSEFLRPDYFVNPGAHQLMQEASDVLASSYEVYYKPATQRASDALFKDKNVSKAAEVPRVAVELSELVQSSAVPTHEKIKIEEKLITDDDSLRSMLEADPKGFSQTMKFRLKEIINAEWLGNHSLSDTQMKNLFLVDQSLATQLIQEYQYLHSDIFYLIQSVGIRTRLDPDQITLSKTEVAAIMDYIETREEEFLDIQGFSDKERSMILRVVSECLSSEDPEYPEKEDYERREIFINNLAFALSEIRNSKRSTKEVTVNDNDPLRVALSSPELFVDQLKQLVSMASATQLALAANALHNSVEGRQRLISILNLIPSDELLVNILESIDLNFETRRYILGEYVKGSITIDKKSAANAELSRMAMQIYFDEIAVAQPEVKFEHGAIPETDPELMVNVFGAGQRLEHIGRMNPVDCDGFINDLIDLNVDQLNRENAAHYGRILFEIISDPRSIEYISARDLSLLNETMMDLSASGKWLDRGHDHWAGVIHRVLRDAYGKVTGTIKVFFGCDDELLKRFNFAEIAILHNFAKIEEYEEDRDKFEKFLVDRIVYEAQSEQERPFYNLCDDAVFGPAFANMVMRSIDDLSLKHLDKNYKKVILPKITKLDEDNIHKLRVLSQDDLKLLDRELVMGLFRESIIDVAESLTVAQLTGLTANLRVEDRQSIFNTWSENSIFPGKNLSAFILSHKKSVDALISQNAVRNYLSVDLLRDWTAEQIRNLDMRVRMEVFTDSSLLANCQFVAESKTSLTPERALDSEKLKALPAHFSESACELLLTRWNPARKSQEDKDAASQPTAVEKFGTRLLFTVHPRTVAVNLGQGDRGRGQELARTLLDECCYGLVSGPGELLALNTVFHEEKSFFDKFREYIPFATTADDRISLPDFLAAIATRSTDKQLDPVALAQMSSNPYLLDYLNRKWSELYTTRDADVYKPIFHNHALLSKVIVGVNTTSQLTERVEAKEKIEVALINAAKVGYPPHEFLAAITSARAIERERELKDERERQAEMKSSSQKDHHIVSNRLLQSINAYLENLSSDVIKENRAPLISLVINFCMPRTMPQSKSEELKLHRKALLQALHLFAHADSEEHRALYADAVFSHPTLQQQVLDEDEAFQNGVPYSSPVASKMIRYMLERTSPHQLGETLYAGYGDPLSRNTQFRVELASRAVQVVKSFEVEALARPIIDQQIKADRMERSLGWRLFYTVAGALGFANHEQKIQVFKAHYEAGRAESPVVHIEPTKPRKKGLLDSLKQIFNGKNKSPSAVMVKADVPVVNAKEVIAGLGKYNLLGVIADLPIQMRGELARIASNQQDQDEKGQGLGKKNKSLDKLNRLCHLLSTQFVSLERDKQLLKGSNLLELLQKKPKETLKLLVKMQNLVNDACAKLEKHYKNEPDKLAKNPLYQYLSLQRTNVNAALSQLEQIPQYAAVIDFIRQILRLQRESFNLSKKIKVEADKHLEKSLIHGPTRAKVIAQKAERGSMENARRELKMDRRNKRKGFRAFDGVRKRLVSIKNKKMLELDNACDRVLHARDDKSIGEIVREFGNSPAIKKRAWLPSIGTTRSGQALKKHAHVESLPGNPALEEGLRVKKN